MMIDPNGDEDETWEDGDYAEDDAQAGQLALDDGEQLPWLDSDDDYEDEGVDTTRIAAFAVIGLLIVGLLVGGIWWATRERTDPALVADGSTIAAPEGPYKTKPEDPGGKQFDGTGDASFAVAEGQTREGQIAGSESPGPSIDVATAASPAPAAAPQTGSVGVQVGAYSSRQKAEQGWQQLVAQIPALSGHGHRIEEGQADIGKVFRLQALAGDVASANALCQQIRNSGGSCQVKR